VDNIGDLVAEIRSESLRAAAPRTGPADPTPLSGFPDLLVRNGVCTLQETETSSGAARTLQERRSGHAYVLRGRRLLGRISSGDLPSS